MCEDSPVLPSCEIFVLLVILSLSNSICYPKLKDKQEHCDALAPCYGLAVLARVGLKADESGRDTTQLQFITTLWSVDQIAQLITTHESRVHKMKNNEHEMSIARYYT